ncbi:MAG: mobilome CxxCx(11)CxxC protein [Candidatus Promineifilaceae bacterium]
MENHEKVTVETIRKQCWDEALYAYGTAYIFEQRAQRFSKLLKRLTFLGLVVPAAIGSIVLSFGVQTSYLPIFLTIGGVLGTIQLAGSLWALTSKWEEGFGYSMESSSSNYRLANRFERLAQLPPENLSKLKIQFDLIRVENELRSEQDNKQGITDKEKRMGMRASLRKYQRQCATCNLVPKSMTATTCYTCGNF